MPIYYTLLVSGVRLDGEIYVEIYFPDVPPRNVGFGDFLGKVRVLLRTIGKKGHMVMTHFYQRNVFFRV